MSFDSIIGQPLAVSLCRAWLKRLARIITASNRQTR